MTWTDIPVAAIDGCVVGITGPFVPSDTDFATHGNEEFMLNVYDKLLGGSGTVLHDEGHGQFYTLAPNGVVFLHDQSDFDNFDETDNHNEIASAVNASFRFNDDQVFNDTNNDGVPFVPTTQNFNFEEFSSLFSERNDAGLTTTSQQRLSLAMHP